MINVLPLVQFGLGLVCICGVICSYLTSRCMVVRVACHNICVCRIGEIRHNRWFLHGEDFFSTIILFKWRGARVEICVLWLLKTVQLRAKKRLFGAAERLFWVFFLCRFFWGGLMRKMLKMTIEVG